MSLDKKAHMLTDADVQFIRELAREVYGESPRGLPIEDNAPPMRARYRYAKLIEDCPTGTVEVLASQTDAAGTEFNPPVIFKVQSWKSIIAKAQAGFHARYLWYRGSWDFDQSAECITPCDHSASITGSLSDATVGVSYSDSVTPDGIDPGTLGASGLPTGLTMNTSGAVSGTPGTNSAGTYYVIVSGDAPKTGPGTISGGATCTVTKAFKLIVKPAPSGGPSPSGGGGGGA